MVKQCRVGEFGCPRWPHKPETVGSNPTPATNVCYYGMKMVFLFLKPTLNMVTSWLSGLDSLKRKQVRESTFIFFYRLKVRQRAVNSRIEVRVLVGERWLYSSIVRTENYMIVG